MKKIILTSLVLCSTYFAQAQANKPDKGAFGVAFGADFAGGIKPHLEFRYIASPHIELGLGLSVGHSSNTNVKTDSVAVTTKTATTIAGYEQVNTKITSTNATINPFVLYHFKVQSNLDLYMGAGIPVKINAPTTTTVTDKITATDFSSSQTVVGKNATTVGIGGNLMLGANYFFYKNMAIGASGGLGFLYNSTVSKSTITSTTANSGNNNGNTLNSTVKSTTTPAGDKSFSTNLTGNAGLYLLFYFGGKSAAK